MDADNQDSNTKLTESLQKSYKEESFCSPALLMEMKMELFGHKYAAFL